MSAATVARLSTCLGRCSTQNGELDPSDLDDGLDVDEVDAGDLVGKVAASSASDNFEEGWDLNENDAGDFRVEMTLAEASRNGEEGFDFEEDDDFQGGGNLVTKLVGIKADGNGARGGDAGLKIRERGDGDLDTDIRNAQANGNLSGGINGASKGAATTRPASSGRPRTEMAPTESTSEKTTPGASPRPLTGRPRVVTAATGSSSKRTVRGISPPPSTALQPTATPRTESSSTRTAPATSPERRARAVHRATSPAFAPINRCQPGIPARSTCSQ